MVLPSQKGVQRRPFDLSANVVHDDIDNWKLEADFVMIIYENSSSKNHIDHDCNEGPGVNEDHDPVYHTVVKGKDVNQNLGMHKGPVN